MENYKYDIAISYASEQSQYVQNVVKALQEQSLTVFADYLEPHRFLGELLPEELRKIYHDESKHVLLFLSYEYIKKKYTQYEGRIVCERLLDGDKFFLIKIDDVTLPWLNSAIGYISMEYTPQMIAQMIKKKITTKRDIYITSLYNSIIAAINKTCIGMNIQNYFELNSTKEKYSYEVIMQNNKKTIFCRCSLHDHHSKTCQNIRLSLGTRKLITSFDMANITVHHNQILLFNYGLFRGNTNISFVFQTKEECIKTIKKEIEKIGEILYD
jgi:hypothetical protein